MATNCYSRDRKFAVDSELNRRRHGTTCIEKNVRKLYRHSCIYTELDV